MRNLSPGQRLIWKVNGGIVLFIRYDDRSKAHRPTARGFVRKLGSAREISVRLSNLEVQEMVQEDFLASSLGRTYRPLHDHKIKNL